MAFLLASAEAAELTLAMLIVFGSAKLLAEVFERLGQPGIVGEILAGILIGPSLLGWIRPNETLNALAELGVMFLLFRVGLEVRASELMRIGGTALLVAMLGVALPFAAGWGIMLAWGYSQVEAVFVGTAMVATSVGITAQVLSAKGLLSLVASQVILAAAVIDDILGLLVLAVVSNSAKGDFNIVGLAVTALLAAGFTMVLAKWGTKTIGAAVPRVSRGLNAAEAQFNLALVLLFALSLLAIYAGVAAIIGAFLAGMVLSESVSGRVQDLVHGITELLVPFFLVGIGLRVDVWAFRDPAMLGLALIVLLAAVLTKLIGCGAGAWRLGRTEMFRIGVGMVPRGEVGMVVAQIGLGMGVIEGSVYSVVVFMAAATTVVAPPLLNIAFRGAEPGAKGERFEIG